MDSHPMPHPARKVITTRKGGVSQSPYDSFNLGSHVGDEPDAVAANRHRLAQTLGLKDDHVLYMEQIHSNTVTVVNSPSSDSIPATDALVTQEPGLALVVLVADCVPVLLSDSEAGVVAAIHAGRMGARNGIVKKTVEKMHQLGARPENIHALIGPAASGRHYEVPQEMALDVEEKLPGSLTKTKTGTVGLDLPAGIFLQLSTLGVDHIDVDPRCTIEDPEFFSYRRDKVTGRQAGVVWLDGGSS